MGEEPLRSSAPTSSGSGSRRRLHERQSASAWRSSSDERRVPAHPQHLPLPAGNLADFNSATDAVARRTCRARRWALSELQHLVERVTKAYETYEFTGSITRCTISARGDELVLPRRAEDRLYCEAPSRRSGAARRRDARDPADAREARRADSRSHVARGVSISTIARTDSVHLALWPEVNASLVDEALDAKFAKVLAVRERSRARSKRCAPRKRGSGLEAAVELLRRRRRAPRVP